MTALIGNAIQSLRLPVGSASVPSLSFSGASTTGFYLVNGNIGVSIDGIESATLDSTGTLRAQNFTGNGAGLTGLPAFPGVSVSNIQIADASYSVVDDTAVDVLGGYVVVNGNGFGIGSIVSVGSTPASSTSWVSAAKLYAQVQPRTAGTYSVTVSRNDGVSAVAPLGLTYSEFPAWSTPETLPLYDMIYKTVPFSISLSAFPALSYIVSAGSTLPTTVALASDGTLSGTVTDTIASQTTYSFSIDAVDAEFQNTPRTFSLTALASPNPLDIVGGAASAFGVRLLNSNYSGPLVRIRRSSDNAESNIAPVSASNTFANTAAITSFIGSSNGHVVTWFDQSGNTRHLTQATTTLQPRIATLGNVITRQGMVSVYFDGTSYLQSVSNIDIVGSALFTHVGVHSFDSGYANSATRSTLLSLGNVTNSYTFQYETAPKVSAGFQTNVERANTLSDFTSSIMAINTIRKNNTNGNGWTIRQQLAGKTFAPNADAVVNIANSALVVGAFVDAANRYPAIMHVAELLVYPTTLDDTSLNRVETRMLSANSYSKSTLYMATAAYYATVRNTTGWYEITTEFSSSNMQSYGTTTSFDTTWSSGTYSGANVYAQVVDALVYHTKNRSTGHVHTLNVVNASVVLSSDGLIHAEKLSSTQYKLWGLTELNSANALVYASALVKNYSETTALTVMSVGGTPIVVNENPSMVNAVVSTPVTLYILGAEYAVDASSYYSASYSTVMAFDKTNTNNGWLSANAGVVPQWLSYAYPRAVVLKRYSITANDTTTGWGSPTTFQMQGSSDNTNFTAIDTRSGQTWSGALGETRVFVVASNTTAYRYYRLYITLSTVTNWTAVDELRLYTIPA